MFLVKAEVLEKPKAQIAVLKDLYNRLAEIVGESPGLYYRLVELILRPLMGIEVCLLWASEICTPLVSDQKRIGNVCMRIIVTI